MADMTVVVSRYAAHVHANLAGHDRHKGLFFACQRVVYLQLWAVRSSGEGRKQSLKAAPFSDCGGGVLLVESAIDYKNLPFFIEVKFNT